MRIALRHNVTSVAGILRVEGYCFPPFLQG